MTEQATLTLETATDIQKATDSMIEETTTKAPKAKAKRPAKPAAKKPVRNADKPAKPEKPVVVKPEPVLFHGFELAEGVAVETVETATKKAAEALSAITNTDQQMVGHFLALGEFQASASTMFKSTKLYGEFLKKELPATQDLDPALRSNCKWLWEALNNETHEASDILIILDVNRIENFKSGNPTVIRRSYKATKAEADKAAKLKEKADAEGVDVSEAEKLIKEEAEAQAKKDQATAKRKLTSLEKKIAAFLAHNENAEEQADEAASLIRTLLETNPKDQLAYIESVIG